MPKEIIISKDAPAPIGPYSQAVKAGDWLFASGQIAIDPATGQLVEGGVEAEARQVMKNIEAVLSAAGMSFKQVVKTSIFLASMDDFGKVNAIYGEHFDDTPPARETVAVKTLPKSVNVEISVTAYGGA